MSSKTTPQGAGWSWNPCGDLMKFLRTNAELRHIANMLKQKHTRHEEFFRKAMKTEKFKFFFQRVIGQYIVDFFIPDKNLIVEIDGLQHKVKKIQDADDFRDAFLEGAGFKILRITHKEIENDFKASMKIINDMPNGFWNECLDRANKINKRIDEMAIKPLPYICGHGKRRLFCTDCRYGERWNNNRNDNFKKIGIKSGFSR